MPDQKQHDEAAPVQVVAQEFLKNVNPWPDLMKELEDAFPGLSEEEIENIVP